MACENSDVLFRHLQAHSSEKVDGTRSSTTCEEAVIARQYSSPPSEQVIAAPDPEQQSGASPTDGVPPSHQQSLLPQPLLLDDPSPMLDSLPRTLIYQDPTAPDTSTEMHLATAQTLDVTQQDNPIEHIHGDMDCMHELADFLLQDIPQSPPRQMMHNQAAGETQHVEIYQQEISAGQLPFDILETLEPQLNVDLLSVTQLEENGQQGQLPDEGFELFGRTYQQMSPPDDFGVSLNMMDYLDCLDSGMSTLPLPMPVASIESTSSALIAPSESQAQLMGRLWSRQKPKLASRLIRRLWKQVIHHNADNIFTAPKSSDCNDNHAAPSSRQTSRCRVNEACRSRLVRYCKELDWSFRQNESVHDGTRTALREKSPDDHDGGFPAMEILDSSLDFFFHFFHPILPFMHRSTFDARNTPSSLLLAMCLVGLSYLDRAGTRTFVVRYLKVLYSYGKWLL